MYAVPEPYNSRELEGLGVRSDFNFELDLDRARIGEITPEYVRNQWTTFFQEYVVGVFHSGFNYITEPGSHKLIGEGFNTYMSDSYLNGFIAVQDMPLEQARRLAELETFLHIETTLATAPYTQIVQISPDRSLGYGYVWHYQKNPLSNKVEVNSYRINTSDLTAYWAVTDLEAERAIIADWQTNWGARILSTRVALQDFPELIRSSLTPQAAHLFENAPRVDMLRNLVAFTDPAITKDKIIARFCSQGHIDYQRLLSQGIEIKLREFSPKIEELVQLTFDERVSPETFTKKALEVIAIGIAHLNPEDAQARWGSVVTERLRGLVYDLESGGLNELGRYFIAKLEVKLANDCGIVDVNDNSFESLSQLLRKALSLAYIRGRLINQDDAACPNCGEPFAIINGNSKTYMASCPSCDIQGSSNAAAIAKCN